MTMSKIHIKYMTDEALETLKANTSVITERLTENQISSTQLSEFIPSELYVTKKYEIEEFTLRVPKDEKDRETDIYNSILLYERLHHLPLYVLTDERFWCWMNFEMGYEVALKYMPVKKIPRFLKTTGFSLKENGAVSFSVSFLVAISEWHFRLIILLTILMS